MASSIATTASASAASVTKITPKSSSNLPLGHLHCSQSPSSKLSFRLSHKPRIQFLTKNSLSRWNRSIVVKAQLNEVSVDGSSNSVASPTESALEFKDTKPYSEPSLTTSASEESISEFIAQVSNIIKLVDSRDIVELELKQLGCELLIRKKEALPQPPSSAPVVMMHSQAPQAVGPPAYHAPPPAAAPAGSPPAAPSAPAPPPALPAAKSAMSSHPPLKSPMAGTFYRSPAPGESAFVKVGDKVKKGQVLCIIEAMKLMNEIEADQAGTVVEVIAEDGKPVSVDTPLFVIEP